MGDAEIEALHQRHLADGVELEDLDPDPGVQTQRWWDEAIAVGVHQPEAVALATADAQGRPSVRFVLLRGLDHEGWRFYTNYDSTKAQHLDANPYAAMDLAWVPIGRQVRVEGPVRRTSAEDSDAYWASRPRGSQLAARASLQSRPVDDRATMQAGVATVAAEWEGQDVPRPDGWGGYVLTPERYELWNGRPDRLHDRFEYRPDGPGAWTIRRLWP